MIRIKLEQLSCLRLGGRYSQKSGWDHTGKALHTNMLVMLESGDCEFKIRGEKIALTAGDVLLIPKDTWYQPCTQNGCSYQYFHFDADEVRGSGTPLDSGRAYRYCEPITQMSQILTIPTKSVADIQTKNALSATLDEMRSDAPESYLKMHICFFSALIRLCERARKERETPADQVKNYMVEHAFDRITLASVALRFGYTKQHVIRIFKARFSMTPTEFIDQYRLEQGMRLLSESDMTVDEIARASGFEDANYFSRRFRKRFGTSPTAYRAHLQSGL